MSQFCQSGGFNIFQKCLKFKNVPIWSEGVGGVVNIFQKCPKFKNVPKVGRGGVNPNWDIVPNFTFFFSDASPKSWSSFGAALSFASYTINIRLEMEK